VLLMPATGPFLHVGGSGSSVFGRLAIGVLLCFNSLFSSDHHKVIVYSRCSHPLPNLGPHFSLVIDSRAARLKMRTFC
jgi:hypothetical protein